MKISEIIFRSMLTVSIILLAVFLILLCFDAPEACGYEIQDATPIWLNALLITAGITVALSGAAGIGVTWLYEK